jgi:sugar phosphate isomerase/epimerase
MNQQERDISKLCIHTITTKPWSIEEAAKHFSAAGVKGITVWRDALDERNIRATGNMLREHDLTIVSLCRGGFFAHKAKEKLPSMITKKQLTKLHNLEHR